LKNGTGSEQANRLSDKRPDARCLSQFFNTQQGANAMQTQTSDELVEKKCLPCEGGVPKYSLGEAAAQLEKLPQWSLVHGGQRIRREWTVKNFMAGIDFFNRVAQVAEQDGHHPDLHLEGYRNLAIELWTHAIGGLSENDFILAAKIDRLPIVLKK
jgi:4a-hydroxytetrahydrobiopterin dehydratase